MKSTVFITALLSLSGASGQPYTYTSEANPFLEHVADVQFDLGVTIFDKLTPLGTYVYASIAGGTFNITATHTAAGTVNTTATAERPLHATILPGASDYARILDDGSFRLDVTGAAQDPKSGHLFQFTTYGSFYAPGLNFSGTVSTKFGEIDAYQVIRVNTASKQYGWLNRSQLVAQERTDIVDGQTKHIGLRVFRVVVKTLG